MALDKSLATSAPNAYAYRGRDAATTVVEASPTKLAAAFPIMMGLKKYMERKARKAKFVDQTPITPTKSSHRRKRGSKASKTSGNEISQPKKVSPSPIPMKASHSKGKEPYISARLRKIGLTDDENVTFCAKWEAQDAELREEIMLQEKDEPEKAWERALYTEYNCERYGFAHIPRQHIVDVDHVIEEKNKIIAQKDRQFEEKKLFVVSLRKSVREKEEIVVRLRKVIAGLQGGGTVGEGGKEGLKRGLEDAEEGLPEAKRAMHEGT
ncbi:hypothetical protein EJ08DRAFT_677757 [Tothia fuscella]|uniref:Uncharacterized protein n=1 Tax=Tothia fuscella TaxID=1048955 RepID=A0A9P4NV03_9PEZI|nr:hypothetical protein EJ08DRAFT_677757 [Tothia fuscella]